MPYVKNGIINLLLIKDEHNNGRYLYIKKLENFLHTTKAANYKNRSYCPLCRNVIGADEIFEELMMHEPHTLPQQLQLRASGRRSSLELPDEGAA